TAQLSKAPHQHYVPRRIQYPRSGSAKAGSPLNHHLWSGVLVPSHNGTHWPVSRSHFQSGPSNRRKVMENVGGGAGSAAPFLIHSRTASSLIAGTHPNTNVSRDNIANRRNQNRTPHRTPHRGCSPGRSSTPAWR